MNNSKLFIKAIFIITTIIVTFAPLATHLAQANQEANGISQGNSYEEIDAYIEKQLDTLKIPAASLAIIEGDKIVHTKGFSVTGSGGETPTPQTPFFIGSLTKSFTALAVMQLVEAGKIDLDAPVQTYLPWFTLADPQAAAQITVRHLLNQTSGISQIPGMLSLANFDDTPGANERQIRALATYELAYPVGSGWDYSNVNFNLLGLVIEAASGETYADYVQNHIYTPLSMEHSYTSKAIAQQDNLAVGHQQWFGFPVAVPNMRVPVASLPSGQLISSAEDMGHYIIAQLNEGEYDDAQILSAEGTMQMHQPAADASASGLGDVDYGMGWFVKNFDQGQLIFHHGEVPDYFAYMALLPEQDRAMVLLINTNHQLYSFALLETGEAAALQLAGVSPQPNGWNVLPKVMPFILLLPVLQIIFIIAALLRIKRWKTNASKRPGVVNKWLFHILLPTIINLLLVFTAVGILASGMLNFIMLFMGDMVSTLLISGAIALVWIFIRTPLILRALRKPGSDKKSRTIAVAQQVSV
ncbi:MAG: beta-lactamase family protein [Anaerolineales bacterium]|nr:beta-lactamase family protein [Anaerolineales bacterium]